MNSKPVLLLVSSQEQTCTQGACGKKVQYLALILEAMDTRVSHINGKTTVVVQSKKKYQPRGHCGNSGAFFPKAFMASRKSPGNKA
jgi:hypothetical protein